MTNDLRTRMHHMADEVTPLPVADDLWRRGQAARHRGQALAVAAVLVVLASVGGGVALWSGPDREARTASTEVPEGAIPSRIENPGDLDPTDDLAVGRVSVAYVGAKSSVVVVSATDGRYHALDLPSPFAGLGVVRLSPDGRHLAYAYADDIVTVPGETEDGIEVVDLVTGEVTRIPAVAEDGAPVSVDYLGWSADSVYVAWSGDDTLGVVTVATGAQSAIPSLPGAVSVDGDAVATRVSRDGVMSFYSNEFHAKQEPLSEGLPGADALSVASTSPSGELTAVGLGATLSAARFVTEEGDVLRRTLDRDLYPDGAQVSPLGWTQDSLLLARVDGPSGSYVEGPHLALMTSPDRPESEWTYRIVTRDVPDVAELSVAVDLVPDLDGTSSQELTHDFGDTTPDPPAPLGIELSLFIGLGVAAAIALLLGLRWLWRRLT